jgi:hypothetical protein
LFTVNDLVGLAASRDVGCSCNVNAG